MTRFRLTFTLLCLISGALTVYGQTNDTLKHRTLDAVSIGAKADAGVSRLGGAENGTMIGQDALFRAACCNLGESFVANPSVDVNYNDAAVGARQIKLLGLSGQYVQMLVEGLPLFAGAASPYALGYVPGAWMNSIAVSKGASSVKNGYQSITGQIDVEYIKPDADQSVSANIYGDSRLKGEANIMANCHIGKHLSTELLIHGEKDWMHHDANNDGWHDSPAISQINLQNRWKYVDGRYIFHGGIGMIHELREGGQMADVSENPYRVQLGAKRYEAYMKHAFLLNHEHNTNIALTANATLHDMDGLFGHRIYGVLHRDLNARAMLEHEFNSIHSLSTGFSLLMQNRDEQLQPLQAPSLLPITTTTLETVPGVYAEYTYKPSYRLTMMAGLRVDHSNLYGTFVTPRLHMKWMVNDILTLRAAAGKGYRAPFAWAENHYIMASGRQLSVSDSLHQEEAWNSGISAALYIPIGEQTLKVNGEYYYTHFLQQVVVDYDSDPTKIIIDNLHGLSYSHTAQVDASIDWDEEWECTAAFRLNDVRCTYNGVLMEKPLTSRYKGLLTAAWKPYMGLWQVDATLQLNGGGRLPQGGSFPAYVQLNMQITRRFRHLTLYLGGENLTNYIQPVPVINASNPWSNSFEPTMIWGPVHGIMLYAGLRAKK